MSDILGDKKIGTEAQESSYQEEARSLAADLSTVPQQTPPTTLGQEGSLSDQVSKRTAIKTYKDYAAESLRKGGGSLTKMIIAEREKKREKHRRSGTNPKNIAMTVLSVVFVVLGLGLVVGAYLLVQTVKEDPLGSEVLSPDPFILHDYRSEVYIASPTRPKIIKEIEEQLDGLSIEIGALKYIYFATDNQFGGKTLMTTQGLLEGLRTKASGSLIRALDDNFMYGVFSAEDNAPFLILKTDNFSTAYAEMLQWERTIGLDIKSLFETDEIDYVRSNFVDVVYYNNDTRAILNSEGESVLAYSFINPQTIVIFSDKLALKEVVKRLQKNTVKE